MSGPAAGPAVGPAEVVRGRAWDRPVPRPDAVSAPYFRSGSRGRLVFQRCPACGHAQHYPRAMCTACAATPGWEEASGLGEVYTYSVVRQFGAEPFRDEVPYVVAMVRIEEGLLVMGNVTDCPVDEVHIGMPVEVYFVEAAPEVGVPFWRPRPADPARPAEPTGQPRRAAPAGPT